MKGQKALAQDTLATQKAQLALQQQAYDDSKKPSAAETQQETDRKAYFTWRDAGDYTKPPPGLVGNSNFGPAMAHRRDLERTAVPTGAAGIGSGANATALALQNRYLQDVNAESDANAYQNAVSAEDLYQRTGATGALEGLDAARKAHALDTSTNMSQFFSNMRAQTTPQSLWPSIIGGGLSALGQIGAAGVTAGSFAAL